MDKGLYKFLVVTAIVLTLAWIGWSYYDSKIAPSNPGDAAYLAANKLFEDGEYQRALDEKETVGQITRARVISVFVSLLFSFLYNASTIGLPGNG